MTMQREFRRFHEAIQLKRFDENALLREKRDRVLTRLRQGLERAFPYRSQRPTFQSFNQGSYEMGTGVKPLNGDYDIDVGLLFNVDARSHGPLDVKGWVYNAVASHTQRVEWRRPCITVFYQQAGEPLYHVDLAVYANGSWGHTQIAMGKQHSGAGHFSWENSDPRELTKLVTQRFSGEDGAQFCRVIRYLKRWKDVNFSNQGNAAPTGIALTACAYQWFTPRKASVWGGEYDDLSALRGLVDSLLSRFSMGWGQSSSRIAVHLPVAPQNDLFESMTDQQMFEFKRRLEQLSGALGDASYGRASSLRSILGSDFGG